MIKMSFFAYIRTKKFNFLCLSRFEINVKNENNFFVHVENVKKWMLINFKNVKNSIVIANVIYNSFNCSFNR